MTYTYLLASENAELLSESWIWIVVGASALLLLVFIAVLIRILLREDDKAELSAQTVNSNYYSERNSYSDLSLSQSRNQQRNYYNAPYSYGYENTLAGMQQEVRDLRSRLGYSNNYAPSQGTQ